MRSCFVLLFVSLLTSCEAQGTFGTPVFVLKGRDLLLKLHADPPEGVLYVEWKINKTVSLVRLDSSGGGTVTGRFEFPGRFYVIMKNLQEADSGVYSAVAVTSTGDKLVAEYKVTVQGPVSPVELTVDRVDSSSSGSCDLHVTCRTHNSHISSTFRCVDWFCSQEGGERSEVTTSGASLQVYLLHSTIICDHSNQVHRTQDLITAQHFCSSNPDPPSHYGWVIAICILTVILIMIVGLIVWLRNRRKRIISSRQIRAALCALQDREEKLEKLENLEKLLEQLEKLPQLQQQELREQLEKKLPLRELREQLEKKLPLRELRELRELQQELLELWKDLREYRELREKWDELEKQREKLLELLEKLPQPELGEPLELLEKKLLQWKDQTQNADASGLSSVEPGAGTTELEKTVVKD